MPDRLHRPDGKPPRVVVVGGGVAALETVLALRALAGMRVEVELIAPDDELRYPPLEVIEPFGLTPPRVDLTDALDTLGVLHRRERVTAVHLQEQCVTTSQGTIVPYEALVLAIGARALPPPAGALTFGGPNGRRQLQALLDDSVAGLVEQILFAVPLGAAWPLPLYELATLTVQRLRSLGSGSTAVSIVTPERVPLELFGGRASGHVREQLDALGIAFNGGGHVAEILRGEARIAPGGELLPADRVVTMPTLRGPALPGVPHDADGFIPVDRHGAVTGAYGVYAAGDATDQPIKQGGLATQQADAIASAIAARAGAAVTPEPFAGVLRGMLLTAGAPRYLEADRSGRSAPTGSPTPLWWPPTKVAGRYLAPFLAQQLAGSAIASDLNPPEMWRDGSIPCEVTLPVL
ncbi:FAD-dependent oxidoreductase [Conexibacter sp. CPCC 206217]|uniref:FAD-dependent oxidoreductase n=1 Tax=Conexibacter sp. CPCC 206217 TaxID=3064574 RepID=UPI0027230AE1|nr:FAD-dependent oxidoreductase [Conexibacter sp. CPCC 206217]MDO8213579.1 FAD-dependent oxidoreductase [Conexibacter sp. CPCC 206217]